MPLKEPISLQLGPRGLWQPSARGGSALPYYSRLVENEAKATALTTATAVAAATAATGTSGVGVVAPLPVEPTAAASQQAPVAPVEEAILEPTASGDMADSQLTVDDVSVDGAEHSSHDGPGAKNHDAHVPVPIQAEAVVEPEQVSCSASVF